MKKGSIREIIIALVILICVIIGLGTIKLEGADASTSAETEIEEVVHNYENGKCTNCGKLVIHQAIQEVAYSYYMRGTAIQYNSMKGNSSWFSPEEATSQNMNYLVCSAFTKNVYNELLGIKIPRYTYELLDYTKDNVGRPEVIAYGYCYDEEIEDEDGNKVIDEDGNKVTERKITLTIYDGKGNELKTTNSPSLTRDIIPYLQVRRCNYI